MELELQTTEALPELHWQSMNELFATDSPLLIFVKDGFDEQWGVVPDDVAAMLETMQSTCDTDVKIYAVDFRVDPDFLELFGIRRGTNVVRRLPGEDTFDVLRPEFGYGELIEFCREVFEGRQPALLAS
jgi:hypothetical protein